MTKDGGPTQTDFDALLSWLDEDRDRAGEKYESIRRRLIKFFTCRCRPDADELADDTIIRVTKKAKEIAKDYVGEPAAYFYAVARKVFLEESRKRPPVVLPPPLTEKSEETEQEFECLDDCMLKLTVDNRELVIEYHKNEKRAKIEHRKALAEERGVGQNALRIRAHRIRNTLLQCVEDCLEQKATA